MDSGKFIMDDETADKAVALLTHRIVQDLLSFMVSSGKLSRPEANYIIDHAVSEVTKATPQLTDGVSFLGELMKARLAPVPPPAG